ncbi:MAG: phytoene/squalene synthase family protein [Bacteroidota bacterium]|nr:phytoene/squalene synthase family protein [Bacteroidota bacterium]|tara:strand:+ start:1438 stop:2277 length:840 start_codon:yes stop_codon:yes gene_type:complete
MKSIFDKVSADCSKNVTNSYSTSFSLATKMLSKSIRQDIYNIYGFVRFADEIVDTFHDYNKKELLERFIDELNYSLRNKISSNPILNSFQNTVNKYNIDYELINSFLKSMKMDLKKMKYNSEKEYKEYIYGSADVVGLMCLKVFLDGNEKYYQKLKPSAMALGSAFQKVNFLRDLNADFHELNRTYFPNLDFKNFNDDSKKLILNDIENDFRNALIGIQKLPNNSKFGVYAAYKYYKRLLNKLKKTSFIRIKNERIRVPNYQKVDVLARSYVRYRLNIL